MISLETYLGNDQLHVKDNKGIVISNIDHSKIHVSKCFFTKSNILHIPHIKKSLLSVQKFCLENNGFINFIILCFMLKT
jgi:hypothetical protein